MSKIAMRGVRASFIIVCLLSTTKMSHPFSLEGDRFIIYYRSFVIQYKSVLCFVTHFITWIFHIKCYFILFLLFFILLQAIKREHIETRNTMKNVDTNGNERTIYQNLNGSNNTDNNNNNRSDINDRKWLEPISFFRFVASFFWWTIWVDKVLLFLSFQVWITGEKKNSIEIDIIYEHIWKKLSMSKHFVRLNILV